METTIKPMKLASAPTIAELEKCINKFFYSTSYRIEDKKVYNSKGYFPKAIITYKKNRFIFSML